VSSPLNPYAPPKNDGRIPPRLEWDKPITTCTVELGKFEHFRVRMLAGQLKVVMVFIMSAMFVLAFANKASPPILMGPVAAAIGFAAWFAFDFARRKLFKSNESEFDRTLTYSIYDAGFDVSTAHGSTRVEWSSVRHFRHEPKSFLFYTPQTFAYLVPRRALSEDQIHLMTLIMATRRAVQEAPRLRPVRLFLFVFFCMVVLLLLLAVWQFLND
jgi:hypothetical protein